MSQSAPSDSSTVPAMRRRVLGTAALVLFSTLAVEVLFIFATPPNVYSADLRGWQVVVAVLQRGGNPYQLTTFLNWPALWMQILFGLNRLSSDFNISFFHVVRAFLMACEGLAIILTLLLLVRASPGSDSRGLLIVGFALNPVAILLICQHCNFDVIAANFVLLFLLTEVSFQRTRDVSDWLASCFCLGLGILTKTVPLVLSPILLVGIREVRWKARLLGLCLLTTPVALSVSVIYVLAPTGVASNVLAYRSFPGWFGITGLLDLADLHPVAAFYTTASSAFFAMGLTLLSLRLVRRRELSAPQLVLLAALLLMAVVIFGPGYGPQYIFWYLPLLVASWALWPGGWRVALVAFALVATLTYVAEYGLLQSHGMLFIRMGLGGTWLQRSKDFGTPPAQTLVRLPLFLAYLILFFTGVAAFSRSMRATARVPPVAYPAEQTPQLV